MRRHVRAGQRHARLVDDGHRQSRLAQSGAIYLVQLNPSTASFANVTGTATLGGATVNAVFAAGSYVAKQYTILTAAASAARFGARRTPICRPASTRA